MTAAVLALALSAAVSGAVALLSTRSARLRGRPPKWDALGPALGYALGHSAMALPTFPPADVTTRIPYLALASALLSMILTPGQGGLARRLTTSLGLAVLTYLVMLSPLLSRAASSSGLFIQLVAAGLAALLAVSNIAFLDNSASRSELLASLVVLSLGSAFAFLMARSAILFLLALVLSASLLGACLSRSTGLVPVGLTILSALTLESYFYASLPPGTALVLAASPSVVWTTRLAPIARLGMMSRSFFSAALMALLVSAVLFLL